ncbi:MAG: hypothetical protein ROR55_19210 [Devosia sp.]
MKNIAIAEDLMGVSTMRPPANVSTGGASGEGGSASLATSLCCAKVGDAAKTLINAAATVRRKAQATRRRSNLTERKPRHPAQDLAVFGSAAPGTCSVVRSIIRPVFVGLEKGRSTVCERPIALHHDWVGAACAGRCAVNELSNVTSR